MPERCAHLVGSLPGDDALQAMSTAMEILGPHLRSLPDGETGERRNWIVSIIDALRDNPDLELTKVGDWSDYDKTPVLKIRKGHTLYGANLDFGHIAAVQTSFPIFQQIREKYDRPDLAFQSGVPGDFDMAMFSMGPVGALRHRRPFTEATIAEIRGVRAIAGDDAIFQIEVPAELVLLAKAPRRALPVLAGRLAGVITKLAAGAPPDTRIGLHLCVGDMNNKAFANMKDVAPLVALANAVVQKWPDRQTLEFIHAPFAAADKPAPVDATFYAPLSGLKLPTGTRFSAGFAHESQDLADQLKIRDLIDAGVGRAVDIASACGFGRRSTEDGRKVLERTAELLAS